MSEQQVMNDTDDGAEAECGGSTGRSEAGQHVHVQNPPIMTEEREQRRRRRRKTEQRSAAEAVLVSLSSQVWTGDH